MPSADLFLQLLEEKDLVSEEVLEAARRELQRSSPPPDAFHISLWLVQGQHITASQAQRLMAAAAQQAEASPSEPPLPMAFQPKPFQQGGPADQVDKPGGRAFRRKLPDSRPTTSTPAPEAEQDLELAALAEDGPATARPPKSSAPPPKESGGARPAGPPADSQGMKGVRAGGPATSRGKKSPRAGSPSDSQGMKIPSVPSPADSQGMKSLRTGAAAASQEQTNPSPAKIGAELEPLEEATKGPLDALSEREALEADPFDAATPQLMSFTAKKFTFRRFLRNLFRRNKSKVVRVKAANPRHVKLVLISWVAAVVFLVGLLAVLYAISPQSLPELLQKAEDAMTAEDYRQAIGAYDEILKHYPKSPNADDVRWLRSLAELRLAEKTANAAGDWGSAFEVAQRQVKGLPKERADSDVLQKFGIALAKIGEGLAQEAQAHPDAASVDRVQEVLKMIEADLPESARPADVMLDGIKRILRPVKQAVEGRRQLDQTVDAVHGFVKTNDILPAYAAYREMVQAYPELADDERLTDAMKQVSALQQALVKPAQQSIKALHEERPSGLLAAMPLAVQPVKGELAAGRGKVFFVVERGTAYGLDAATGRTLWRRFVALDPKSPAVTALPIAGPAGSDVVLCDPVHQELLRVRGATGQLVWRLPVTQPFVAAPAPADRWLLLLTKDQHLLLIDLATGETPRSFALPQAVRLPPVFDAGHGLIFLAAYHSNLIVLDADQCRQVLHVGYEAGKIAAPPAIVGDFLLLPINETPSEASIRIFSISKGKEDPPLRQVQTIPVTGSIDTAPVVVGRGAAVVTAQGSLFVLDQNGAGDKLSFQVVASKVVPVQEKSVHYIVPGGNTFWVADRQLIRYAVRADEHRLAPQAISDPGMRFVQDPVVEGGTMFQVLQKTGMPGVTVSAFNPEKGEPVWQTWLAAPLVAEPMLDAVSGKLIAVSASGGMFRGPLADLKPLAKPWESVLAIDARSLSKPLCSLLPLPGEMFAMTSGANTAQIVIYDPKEQDKQFRGLLCPREMSSPPGSFAGGLLAACVNGQVFLLDAEARGNIAKPLPASQGVSSWDWRTPQAVDDKLAVLSDGDKRLMAIRISGGEDKALTEAAAAATKTGLVSPIAILGKAVFVVDSTDRLLSFALPNLVPGRSLALGARCIWGPQRVGEFVLVASEKDRLFAVDEQGKTVWQSVLEYGPLAGAPCLVGDEIFLSARSGTVWRISALEGKERGKVDAGCPLGTGPLVVGPRLVVGGHDGSLLEVKKP